MTDDNIKLTRRKILASAGAIGIAGAGAGLGSNALFTDRESFENNTLAAGELNLQVDWEEHYFNGLKNLDCGDIQIRYLGAEEEPDDSEVGFPSQGPSIVAVAESDVPEFMECTTLESGDGPTDDPPEGVVELEDVKPGDFGELTLCYSIYDNPGYVQLASEELADSEEGRTEPEIGNENDTTGGELGSAIRAAAWYDPGGNNRFEEGEPILLEEGTLAELVSRGPTLLDPAEAAGDDSWVADSPGPEGKCHVPGTDCSELLYLTDTGGSGDSGFDGETRLFEVRLQDGPPPVAELTQIDTLPTDNFTQVDAIAATPSGSAIYFIDKHSVHLGRYDVGAGSFSDLGTVGGLSQNDGIVLATFSPDGTLYAAGQSGGQNLYTIDTGTPTTTGSTSISGVDVQGADIVYGSDGTLYLYSSADGLLYTVDTGNGSATVVGSGQTDKGSLTGLAITESGTGALVGSSESDNAVIVLDKGDGSASNEYEMQLAGSDETYPYGYGDMTVGAYCPEYCIALSWWLPRDVGNEVQTDSYEFDLTLQTEQCRNNDSPFS